MDWQEILPEYFFRYSSVQFDEVRARCIHDDIRKLVKKEKKKQSLRLFSVEDDRKGKPFQTSATFNVSEE
jgi:hypothetical protein